MRGRRSGSINNLEDVLGAVWGWFGGWFGGVGVVETLRQNGKVRDETKVARKKEEINTTISIMQDQRQIKKKRRAGKHLVGFSIYDNNSRYYLCMVCVTPPTIKDVE